MRLLVIGNSVLDEINGKISPGGIFYTSYALDSLISKDDSIVLLTSQDKACSPLFKKVFSKFNTEYITEVDELSKVQLTIEKGKEREEKYLSVSGKLNIPNEIYDLEFDGILLNMITGFDISVDDFSRLKSKFKCPVYFDVHTLSRGIKNDGTRFFRKIEEPEKWLNRCDFVQLNENELKTLSSKRKEESIAADILSCGVQYLLITKGKLGVSLYSYKGKIGLAAEKVVKPVNCIGCGDVFGAVFFYSYISSNNVLYSLETANKAAAEFASNGKLDKLNKLCNDIKRKY